jgi:choline dehydrogenase
VVHDYVIVGAGSAGCVLANRLSEDPAIRVLLLEAGPSDRRPAIHVPGTSSRLLGSPVDWAYTTEPQRQLNGRTVPVPRGRTLGGSSSINALAYLRGDRADYDEWAALGNAGWSYDELLPYFVTAECNERGASAVHGDDGPLHVGDVRDPHPLTHAFVQAGGEAGLPRTDDFNGPHIEGAGYLQLTHHRGRRSSTAVGYLKPVSDRPNLTVVTRAHATRARFDGLRAVGIDYMRRGAAHHAAATREVILCGGVINSPQLLLLSGVGPAEHLRSRGIAVVCDVPGVGRNLQDHVSVGVGFRSRRRGPPALESFANLLRYLATRRGRLASGPVEAAAFLRTSPSLPAPDVELLVVPPRLHPVLPTPKWAAARARDIVIGLARPAARRSPGPPVFAMLVVAVKPRSRGFLELRSSDPFDVPVIHPNYLSDPGGEDLAVLVAGVKLARRVAASPALSSRLSAELQPGPDVRSDEEIMAFVRATATSLQHPAGTCKMGVDALAVVDPELRVRGVKNLRVVDASVVPMIPRGHLNAPTITIAEKAAGLIAGRARSAASARAGAETRGVSAP